MIIYIIVKASLRGVNCRCLLFDLALYFSSKALVSLQVLRTELEVAAWLYDKFLTRKVNQVRSLAITGYKLRVIVCSMVSLFPDFTTFWEKFSKSFRESQEIPGIPKFL